MKDRPFMRSTLIEDPGRPDAARVQLNISADKILPAKNAAQVMRLMNNVLNALIRLGALGDEHQRPVSGSSRIRRNKRRVSADRGRAKKDAGTRSPGGDE